MSGFSVEWLALREPVDAVSRHAELTARLIDWRRSRWGERRLSVLDLGSGTGANCRFLAPRLGGVQHWRLVDHDPALLAHSAALPGSVERQSLDLAGNFAQLDFQDVQLVTASALIDLVSVEWLKRLARRCQEVQAAVLIALTYDGTIVWEPVLDDDATVCQWVNRHQRTDKGFGPALGPQAAPTLRALLESLGYQVDLQPSPWALVPEQATMQTALLEGWLAAVRELAPDAGTWLEAWAMQRRRLIAQGQSRLRVGHWDLFAQSISQPAVKQHILTHAVAATRGTQAQG
ncbi:MAG: SAM-dependent methyltransferase [Pseudomonadota bacterium]|nr:SAM-dependent methyltransferase [Pseudomonadota bacterium]